MLNSFIKREKFSNKWKKQKSIPYLKFEHNPTVKLWTNINATSVVKDIWKLRYVCVSGGRKCSSFGKFSILCFLETPMSRFNLLPYYRQLVMKQASEFIENHELYWSTQSDLRTKEKLANSQKYLILFDLIQLRSTNLKIIFNELLKNFSSLVSGLSISLATICSDWR